MKVMTKEERENAIVGGAVLLGVAVVVGAVLYFTVGLGALLIGGGGLAVIAAGSLAVNLPKLREYRQLARKTHIAELEAATGMAVVRYAGTCRECKAQLVAGAKYCTTCGATTENKVQVCPTCATVNPGNARYCYECKYDFTAKKATAHSV